MKISEFVNSDNGFRGYANYDNSRKIPHLMDGLATTQRKVLYVFVNHIPNNYIVVDKGGMRAADLSDYAHGATSMIDVLIGMNQDFPGSNNMPLFDKDGQFGTRMNHSASSPRYISTKLGGTYNKLFEKDDLPILRKQYSKDFGDEIEPEFYVPKLPLLLINGAKGVGNGYASDILQYMATEVKTAVEEVLKTGLVQTPLTPYLEGYEGGISKDHATGQVTFEGAFERKGSNTIIITELTPGWQLDDYKSHLNYLMNGLIIDKSDKKNESWIKDPNWTQIIKDYDNESTEDSWRFVLDVPRATSQMSDDELMDIFKLRERRTENPTVWMPNGKLKRFATIEQLIEAWVGYRVGFYEDRRQHWISQHSASMDWLHFKMLFIKEWNKNSKEWVTLKKDKLRQTISDVVTDNEQYIDRLLSLRISSLTIEEVESLQAEINKLQAEVDSLTNTTAQKIFSKELKGLKL